MLGSGPIGSAPLASSGGQPAYTVTQLAHDLNTGKLTAVVQGGGLMATIVNIPADIHGDNRAQAIELLKQTFRSIADAI